MHLVINLIRLNLKINRSIVNFVYLIIIFYNVMIDLTYNFKLFKTIRSY